MTDLDQAAKERAAKDKILARIQALLAMGGDVSSENEAKIALRRARSLMDEHQITLNDIENIEADDLGTSQYDVGGKRQQRWVTDLAVSVARLNDCIVKHATRRHRGENKRYEFQGFKEDTKMCEFMLVYLVDTCNRLYQRDKVKLGLKGSGDKNDYLQGITHGLKERIKEIIAERQLAKASDGRSLMVVKIAVVEDEFGKAKYKTTKIKIGNYDAFSDGEKSAKEVHLGSFVGSESANHAKITA